MVFHSILRIFVCHFDIKQWFCMEIYPLELHEVSITLCQTSMLAIFWWEKKTTSSSFFSNEIRVSKLGETSYKSPPKFCFLQSFRTCRCVARQNPRGPFKGAAQLLGVDPGPMSTDGQVLNSAGRHSGFQKPMVSLFFVDTTFSTLHTLMSLLQTITYRSYSLEGKAFCQLHLLNPS